MSDISQEAEEMMKRPNGYAPSLITQITGGLVAEIKRLQEELASLSDASMEQLAAKDSLNSDLMANCNQLRDRCWKLENELARWRQIATVELCKTIAFAPSDALKSEYMQYAKLAAKELNLQSEHEMGYTERLERAYIADSMQSEELARAALNKIREGK